MHVSLHDSDPGDGGAKSNGAYRRRSWLARLWDWLRGSRTVIGVDVAVGSDHTLVTTMTVRKRRDGVHVVEDMTQTVVPHGDE